MYDILLWLTGLAAVTCGLVGYLISRDVFHPLVFLGPMLAFSYFLTPLVLTSEGTIWRFLPADQMAFVQFFYLAGTLALAAGVMIGGYGGRWRPGKLALVPSWSARRQLRRAGLLLGGIGVAAFLYMIRNNGGLEATYSVAHGRGWSSTGYIREAFFLIVPALMLLLVANSGQRIRRAARRWMAVIASPLMLHGVLSAARGPTSMVLITLVVGWYMVRCRRPPLVLMAAGLGATGVLLLALVTSRSSIHLGGTFELSGFDRMLDFVGRATSGNEYILGSGIIINSRMTGSYEWGLAYLLTTVIRAIPRQVWPTQYEDTVAFFGMPGYDVRDTADFADTLGWTATNGAAAGLFAEVWQQFWWFGIILLFTIGWCYGRAWLLAVRRGGLWMMIHVIMLALSIFLTQQGFAPMLFRILFLGGAGWIVWRFMVRGRWHRPMALPPQFPQVAVPAGRQTLQAGGWHP